MNSKFEQAIQLFDQSNSKDPNKDIENGKSYPKELLYAQRMSNQLNNFEPKASEAVQLAVHCQHICRWEIPRNSYEMNRVGYLKWRKDLYQFHATKASEILTKVGYDPITIDDVTFLLKKNNI